MFGNLVNNRQLAELRKLKIVEIDPFNSESMSLAHYTLHIRKIKKRDAAGTLKTVHDFVEDSSPYEVKPNEFLIVQIQEIIKLNEENIVGHFIPASNLIEDGFSLTAGKIDKKFGSSNKQQKQEVIHFGLKNLQDLPSKIAPFYRIAHLSLFDLRGVTSEGTKLSEQELKIRIRRMVHAMDAGVNYEED